MLHRIIIVVNDVFILCTSNCIRCYIQLQWRWRTREKESIKVKPTINCKINGTQCTVDELITNATVVAFGFEDDSLNFYFYTLKVPLPFSSGVSRWFYKVKPTINCKINGIQCTVDELITNATVVAFGFEDDSLNFYFYTLKVPLPFSSGVSRVSAENNNSC